MNRTTNPLILFTYNAKSGLGNALLDYGKKQIAPSSYDCQLCLLSHGAFGMKREWKNFVDTLPHPVVFLHKDEVPTKYPMIATDYPSMVLIQEDDYRVLMSSQDINDVTSLKELQSAVIDALKNDKESQST